MNQYGPTPRQEEARQVLNILKDQEFDILEPKLRPGMWVKVYEWVNGKREVRPHRALPIVQLKVFRGKQNNDGLELWEGEYSTFKDQFLVHPDDIVKESDLPRGF